MKKMFGFILVAASLLLASGAQAQGLHVRANVPFDFIIGDTMYNAGNIDIAAQTGAAVSVLSENKMSLLLPHECSGSGPAKKTVLLFHRVGDEYYLYQVWSEGRQDGREFPQPKRETRLAKNEKAETVVVAANLVIK